MQKIQALCLIPDYVFMWGSVETLSLKQKACNFLITQIEPKKKNTIQKKLSDFRTHGRCGWYIVE